jgi:UDP-glucose 6-dehydrogenase
MEEIFITKIQINKVRHLENIEIPIDEKERKHLILTGKNGSIVRVTATLMNFLKRTKTEILSGPMPTNTFRIKFIRLMPIRTR